MESWGWVLVALLAFGALQLLALRYAIRRDGSGAASRGVGPHAIAPARMEETRLEDARVEEARVEPGRAEDGRAVDAGPDDDALRCPRCGTANRAGFTYCRNCVGFLSF